MTNVQNELEPFQDGNGNQAISIRNLYVTLELNITHFKRWIKRNLLDCEFYVEGTDYTMIAQRATEQFTDYAITIDCAKSIAMTTRSAKGHEVRLRFIEIEKEWKDSMQLKNDPDISPMGMLNNFEQVLAIAKRSESERIRLENLTQKQEQHINKIQPLADYVKTLMGVDDLVTVSQAAKLLNLPYGRNTLFEKLRDDRIFFKQRNEPMQQYINSGYFVLKQRVIKRDNHQDKIVLTSYVTQKGLTFLYKRYVDDDPSNRQLALVQ